MSESKHTPGPWTVETYHGRRLTITTPEWLIAHVLYNEVDGADEANGRLIAAAPDMLVALHTARIEIGSWLISAEMPATRRAHDAVVAAIAKAEVAS